MIGEVFHSLKKNSKIAVYDSSAFPRGLRKQTKTNPKYERTQNTNPKY